MDGKRWQCGWRTLVTHARQSFTPPILRDGWTNKKFYEHLDMNVPLFVQHIQNELGKLQNQPHSGPCYLRFIEKFQIRHASTWPIDRVRYACLEKNEFTQLKTDILPSLGVQNDSISHNSDVFILHQSLPRIDSIYCTIPKLEILDRSNVSTSNTVHGLVDVSFQIPFQLKDFVEAQRTPEPLKWDFDAVYDDDDQYVRISMGLYSASFYSSPLVE